MSKPLVFIIDELDRCKPTFALNLIERIKHLFSVDGICFVLVANFKALEESISRTYGLHDARTCLEKFWQIRVCLPDAQSSHFSDTNRARYIGYLREHLSEMLGPSPFETLEELSRIQGCSLRTMERIFLNLALAYNSVNVQKRESRYLTEIAVGLCVMKTIDPELYERARTGAITLAEARSFMKFESWRGSRQEDVENLWFCAAATDDELSAEPERLERFKTGTETYQDGVISRDIEQRRRDLIPKTCGHIDEFSQYD